MVPSPFRFSVQIQELSGARARERVLAYVQKRSSTNRESLRARLEAPPVLLAREVSLATARQVVADVARLGASLAVRSSESRAVVADFPMARGSARLKENLKPLLAAALGAGESLKGAWLASARVSVVECLATGGLPAYLARRVVLAATDRRLIVIGVGVPAERPLACLYALAPGRMTAARPGRSSIAIAGDDGSERGFGDLAAGEAAALAAFLEAAARAANGPAFVEPLCRVCGASLAGKACARCGTARRSPARAVGRSLVMPGWPLFDEGQTAAGVAAVLGSAATLAGLKLWHARAVASGLELGLSLGFPAAIWAVWAGAHGLAEWTRWREMRPAGLAGPARGQEAG